MGLGDCMMTQVRKIGNSLGSIIPSALIQRFGLVEGTQLNIKEQNGMIVIEPVIPVKKLPFSEQDLLADITAYTAHADELAVLSAVELGE